jgi:CHAT domain-containing protein
VLSLWSIDDRVTVEFMHTFYELLAQRVDRAEALAKASDAVRVKYPDPYHWAPFILLGDAGPLRSAPAAAAGHGT